MLHYERLGAGKTVVFIHGFLGSCNIYEDVKSRLSSMYDTIFIDFAGHGKSADIEVEPTIEQYAEQIVEVLRHENVKQSTWVGHSMGGYIVLAALEKKLATIEKAVLAFSTVNADDEKAKKKRDDAIKKIDEQGKKIFIDDTIPAFFADNASEKNIEKARHIAYEASEVGLKNALLAMKSRTNQQGLIDTLTIPLLAIHGSADNVVPTIETKNEHVQVVMMPTGHLGMIDEPELFISIIKDFI